VALIVAIVVAVLLIILVVALLLRRKGRQQWETNAQGAAAEASSLVGVVTQGLTGLDDPTAAARTWSAVETRGARLHDRLRGLAQKPPNEQDGTIVNRMDGSLQSLRSALDADRALRVGPPPPTAEQLGYSAAVVRQRLADFEPSAGQLEDRLRERA
jgi:hypothetical protein